MSNLTLRDLLAFDAGPWHAAADAWQHLARGIEAASEQLLAGTRDLGEVWPEGDGSAAALRKAAMLRAEVENSYLPAKRLADAFDRHAYTLQGLRDIAGASSTRRSRPGTRWTRRR